MNNYAHQKVYKVKAVPATNTKGTRIKITNLDTGVTKIEPYKYQFKNIEQVATYYIEEMYTTLPVMNSFYDNKTLYLICY